MTSTAPLSEDVFTIESMLALEPSSSNSVETSSALDQQNKKKRKQVKKACLNCRISHAACGEERPCKRCKAHHLELSCVDIERKNSKALKQRRLQESSQNNNSVNNTVPDFSRFVHQNLLGMGTIEVQRELNGLIQRSIPSSVTIPQHSSISLAPPSSTSVPSQILESSTTDLVNQIVNNNFVLQQQILKQLNVVSSQDSSPFSVQSIIKNEQTPDSILDRSPSPFFNYTQATSNFNTVSEPQSSIAKEQRSTDPVELLLQGFDWPSSSKSMSVAEESTTVDLFSSINFPPFSESKIEDTEKRKIKEESSDAFDSPNHTLNSLFPSTLSTPVTSNRSSNGCVVLPYFEEESSQRVHLSMIWYPDGSLYSCNEQALEIFHLEKEFIPSLHSQQLYHSTNSSTNSSSKSTPSDQFKKRVYFEDFLVETSTEDYHALQLIFKGKSSFFETDALAFRIPPQFLNSSNSTTKYVGFASFHAVKSNWSQLKYITSHLFIEKQTT